MPRLNQFMICDAGASLVLKDRCVFGKRLDIAARKARRSAYDPCAKVYYLEAGRYEFDGFLSAHANCQQWRR